MGGGSEMEVAFAALTVKPIYLGHVYHTYRQVGKRRINVSLQKTVRGTLNTQLLYLPAAGQKKGRKPTCAATPSRPI